MGLIHEALVKIKQEVGAVGKDGFNQHQKFKFRSIDGIYNAVHAIFAKHGVFTVPRVTSQVFDRYETAKGGAMKSAQLLVEYDLVAADGSTVTFGPVAGEGADAGDKATSKALAMAHKYMLIQALQLETEDQDPDGDVAAPRRPERQEPRRDAGPPPDEAPPAGKDQSETRRKLVESLAAWVNGDKAKAKSIVGFILPGFSSVSKLDDNQTRTFARAWWMYRLCNGNHDDVVDVLKNMMQLPWFDKMTSAELAKLEQWCKQEAARVENEKAGHKTHSPSTKDENGDDPF